MHSFILVGCLIAAVSSLSPPIIHIPTKTDSKVVCYLGRSKQVRTNIGNIDISEVNQHLCTHVIVSQIIIDSSDVILMQDFTENQIPTFFDNLKLLKERDVKILWSWGGWTENMKHYTNLIRDPKTRFSIVSNLTNWIKYNNWDGLDLDWAYTHTVHVDTYIQLVLLYELRLAFHQHNLLLTAAVSGNPNVIQSSYQIPEMIIYLDWINLRAFDLNSDLLSVNLFAPLYSKQNHQKEISVDDVVKVWLSRGVPASKLLLGVPLIAKVQNLANSQLCLPGSPALGLPKLFAFNEICSTLNNDHWKINWDEQQRANWAVKDHQWVSWSSIRSIVDKVDYVKHLGLGGITAWGIGRDDYKGVCGPKWPLLKAMSSVLIVDVPPVDNPPLIQLPGSRVGQIIPCNELGLAADDNNPSKFYKCVRLPNSIQLVPFDCPAGLIFNRHLNVCDWPYNIIPNVGITQTL